MYTGDKVRLREYRREDAAFAQRFINDPEVKVNLAPGIPFPVSIHEEEKWVLSNSSSSNDSYSFAIETREEARYIGGCGINQVDWKNSVATVGIFIGDKDYWNKGYGTDAMRVLVDFCFLQMNVNKVALDVYSFNARAVRCYEKCGFVREGARRQGLFRNGEYHDVILMGILRSEWRDRR